MKEVKFNHFVVLGEAARPAAGSKAPRLRVKCDCGRITHKIKNHVISGRSKCCGHDLCEFRKGRRKDISGRCFGKLTVLRADERHKIRTRLKWWVRCECGSEKLVLSKHLKPGGTQSCGSSICKDDRHGMSKTAIYKIWAAMIARCSNPNNRFWHCYGGRGINVSKRWLRFECFYEDMGDRPSVKHSLDRVDNKRGYAPDNCRWATRDAQANNTRSNVLLTHEGKTMTQTQWERALNLSRGTIASRRFYGWKGSDLFLPKQKDSPRKGFRLKS